MSVNVETTDIVVTVIASTTDTTQEVIVQNMAGPQGVPGPQGPQGIPGTNAQDPNFTVSTGAPGTDVVLTGTYPNQNIQIPRGDVGATGATGATGAQGPPGENAQNPNFTVSTGAPGTDVILSGTYPNQNIQIPRGNAGTNGTNGTDGKTIRNGSGGPSSGLGVDGDFYIDTTADAIYGPKTSGAWGLPTSLIGATGPQGPQGDPGPPGSTAFADLTGFPNDNAALAAEFATKADVLTRTSALIIETDFYNSTSPFAQGLTGTAVSSGTIVNIAGEANNPGIVALRDSTIANGGYRVQTDVTAFRLAGGERCVFVFQVRNARATISGYLGFFDNTTVAVPTDCVCLVLSANGTTASIVGRGRANNTAVDTLTAFAPVLNTWYTAIIEINSDATLATFQILNAAGVEQWTGTTTNIPTASGRETGFGAAVFESTTDAAADIIRLDYIRMEINRTLVR
jgi:hypothetical protein